MFGKNKKQREENRKQRKENNKVVSCEIWNEETKHKSGAGRAIAGGLMFGPVGAIAGAASKRDKGYTTFRIEYQDGRVDFEKCETGSLVYNIYIGQMQRLEKERRNT